MAARWLIQPQPSAGYVAGDFPGGVQMIGGAINDSSFQGEEYIHLLLIE